MAADLQAHIRPRPIRIAFLVADSEHAHLALDGIFADAFGRWGGRFSLIVPCVDGRLRQSYWRWLEAYDPDIVYSYVDLLSDAIQEIHERLGPTEYMSRSIIGEPRLDVHGFKPDFRFRPLSSLSTIFRQARYGRSDNAGAPVKILDSWFSETPTRFMTDNFGTYHWSCGTGMFPTDARPAATLKTIVAQDVFTDRRFGVPRDLDVLHTELEAFNEFVQNRASSMSIASISFATKLDFPTTRWGGSFNLVVGDTFADRVLHWNARLLIPSWLDTDLCCLRLDENQLDNPDFISILGELLKRRNRVGSGSSGQSEITIRSTSLSDDRLNEIRLKIASTRPWSGVRAEIVTSLDEVVPSATELQNVREGNRFGDQFFQRPDWDRFKWTPPILRPPSIAPDHLSDAPLRQQFTQGSWALDLDIEMDDVGTGSGDRNSWMLPRSWRLASAFKVTRTHDSARDFLPTHRRSRDGALAVFLNNDASLESILVPNSNDAIRYGLCNERAELRGSRTLSVPKAAMAEASNEARYLAGVIGLIGDRRDAAVYLLHPFLGDLFRQLGGTPNVPDDKVRSTINALKKRTDTTQQIFDIRDEKERDALARLIVRAAAGLKTPRQSISMKALKESWSRYRKAYWTANPQPQMSDDDIDWDSFEEKSLDDCLIELRRRQTIFQGFRWICQKCHHSNWVDMSSLRPTLVCEVCKAEKQTPIEIDWLFRPNEFLVDCLRNRSTLSLIWVIHVLSRRARRSFYYSGPTNLFYTEDSAGSDRPNAEVDILAVVDGQAIICESKSSWSTVTRADVQKLVALAKRLRPNLALLAVMETGGGLHEDIGRARAELNELGIELEVLTPQQDNLLDSPYLPSR